MGWEDAERYAYRAQSFFQRKKKGWIRKPGVPLSVPMRGTPRDILDWGAGGRGRARSGRGGPCTLLWKLRTWFRIPTSTSFILLCLLLVVVFSLRPLLRDCAPFLEFATCNAHIRNVAWIRYRGFCKISIDDHVYGSYIQYMDYRIAVLFIFVPWIFSSLFWFKFEAFSEINNLTQEMQ